MVDADGDFSAGATEVALTLTGTTRKSMGNIPRNGNFFTFATAKPVGPGCIAVNTLWLKADTGTDTITNGSVVSSWRNSAIGADLISGTTTTRPIFRNSTGLLNFNPVVDFDGVDDFMTSTDNYGVSGTGNFTSYGVVRRASNSTLDMIWGQANYATNVASFYHNASSQINIDAANI